jgi:diguanylate cyclase (GGDEF)-like protein/PAS domain S-box-containing protein
MHRLSTIFLISLCLAGLTLISLVGAHYLGMLPAGFATWEWTKPIAFITCAVIVSTYVFLYRVFHYIEPANGVSERVRTTLDTLAEGLVILDGDGRIVMANRAFVSCWNTSADELQGSDLADVLWPDQDMPMPIDQLPWRRSMAEGRIQAGNVLQVRRVDGARSFRVNSSPMFDDDGVCRGVLASFDDITVLEERNVALTNMLTRLRKSRDQIHRQNQELQFLAARDPLTGAINRRSFFELFEKHWNETRAQKGALACVMIDVDHFKSINDRYGHAVGDDVLRGVVQVLRHGVRDSDLVARYGGEEFCILMPGTELPEAFSCSERLRESLAGSHIAGVRVTASVGVSVSQFGASSPQELLNQADQALYSAKNRGRNCTREWSQLDSHDLSSKPASNRRVADDTCENSAAVSFQTVTALVTALAYRDVATAEHSRRVADLCVAIGSELMSLSDCYMLENAALLHDIGNIGVPDAVLLKPGPLSADEREIISTHDRMSVDLVNSTFGCQTLTDIVACHHLPYRGPRTGNALPQEQQIPLGARILAIADAYDAMVNDRVYRPAMSEGEAFAELRKCAGQQFDPELVELFIDVVGSRGGEDDRSSLQAVNKRTALLLGIQLENLAKALDQRDPETLANLAAQLKATAEKCGVAEIAELAECLANSAEKEDAWVDNVRMTVDLMELCRITQRSHLAVGYTERVGV